MTVAGKAALTSVCAVECDRSLPCLVFIVLGGTEQHTGSIVPLSTLLDASSESPLFVKLPERTEGGLNPTNFSPIRMKTMADITDPVQDVMLTTLGCTDFYSQRCN